jgi:hypothetical protein
MVRKYTLSLVLKDYMGETIGHVNYDLDEFTPVEIAPPSPFGLDSFSGTVERLKARQSRRDFLADTAKRLGSCLSNFLEDKEGWHGEHRQELTKNYLKRM